MQIGLTCYPKRQGPRLLAGRPPCRSLLLPLQQPMGGVQSCEGCQLLEISKEKEETSLVQLNSTNAYVRKEQR